MANFLRYTTLIASLMLSGFSAKAETGKTGLHCGFYKISFFKRISVCPIAVNDRPIAFIGISRKEIAALSGRHRISLDVNTQLEHWVGPFVIRKDVVANLIRGKSYEAEGRIEGRRVFVWIKDKATGKRVSNTATFKFKECGPIGLKCVFSNILQD